VEVHQVGSCPRTKELYKKIYQLTEQEYITYLSFLDGLIESQVEQVPTHSYHHSI
jgi:hypothetical protein